MKSQSVIESNFHGMKNVAVTKEKRVISVIPIKHIEKKILFLRGEKVMLDRDLAELYEVTTFNLNKAVK